MSDLCVASVFHIVEHKFCLQRILLDDAPYLLEVSNPKWETWLRSMPLDLGVIASVKVIDYVKRYGNVFDGRPYQTRLKELAGF